MAKGIIGQPYTFTTLFVNEQGDPLAVDNPTIEVFTFSEAGERISLVDQGTPLPLSTPVEMGRYAYTFLIDGSLTANQQVFAVLRGENPLSGDVLLATIELDLFAEGECPGPRPGLHSHFVKPSGF